MSKWTPEALASLRRDIIAGQWLRANATKVLCALIDANPRFALEMCTAAFGMTPEQIRAGLMQERDRRAEDDEPETEH
jgi:hypothetical protein